MIEMVRNKQKQKRLRSGGKNTWRRTIQESLNDTDNHDGVVTHIDLYILECKVKWALGSIVMNKASGGDRIIASYSKF